MGSWSLDGQELIRAAIEDDDVGHHGDGAEDLTPGPVHNLKRCAQKEPDSGLDPAPTKTARYTHLPPEELQPAEITPTVAEYVNRYQGGFFNVASPTPLQEKGDTATEGDASINANTEQPTLVARSSGHHVILGGQPPAYNLAAPPYSQGGCALVIPGFQPQVISRRSAIPCEVTATDPSGPTTPVIPQPPTMERTVMPLPSPFPNGRGATKTMYLYQIQTNIPDNILFDETEQCIYLGWVLHA